jgi:hypothetical protein
MIHYSGESDGHDADAALKLTAYTLWCPGCYS